MTFILELDSNGTAYSTNLQIQLPGAKRAEPNPRREWSTTAVGDTEENLQYSIADRKKASIQIQGLFYSYREDAGQNDDGDVSNGTLQNQIDAGNIDVSSDPRFTSTNSDGDQIVKTVEEKIAWLNEYIFANVGAPQNFISGGQFSDSSGSKKCVIESVSTPQENDWTANYTINLKLGDPV